VALAALAVAMLPGESQAFGRRKTCCNDIAPPCCAPAPCGAPAVVAPAPVKYVAQTVTKYKQEIIEKDVVSTVHKLVQREEKFKYTVNVPVTVAEKRLVTYCKIVQKEVPYTYNVCVPVVTPEKRLVTYCKIVEKQVPYTYTVMVPSTVQKTVKQTFYHCVPEVVTHTVPVCSIVRVPVVDACGCCTYVCQRVTEMKTVSCTVMKQVATVKDVVINEVICTPVKKDGVKIVCEPVTYQQEVTVNVCTYKMEAKTGVRMVCEPVTYQQEVTVNVCSYKTEERVGTRIVCDTVAEKVTHKVKYCVSTPYTEVIQVPVHETSVSCCAPSCEPYCGHHGLFRRR
jgi:hypothetical protein